MKLFQLFLLFLSAVQIFASTPQSDLVVQRFTEDDGFSESLVTSAIQDSTGYIWVASWDGLRKYDGYRFVTYKARPYDDCPLASNRIHYLEETPDHKILCKAAESFYIFDPKSEKFEISTKQNIKISAYQPPLQAKEQIQSLEEYDSLEVRFLLVDRQQGVWIYSHQGLERISHRQPLRHPCKEITGKEEYIRGLYLDHLNRIWVADKNDYVRVYTDGQSSPKYLTPSGNHSSHPVAFGSKIYCFYEDSRGDLWLGAKPDGLFRLRPRGKDWDIRHFTSNPEQPYGLNCDAIYDITEDADKRLLIATYGGGLNIAEVREGDSVLFYNSSNILKLYPEELSRCRCLEVLPSGILLIGTTNGLLVTSLRLPYDQMQFYVNQRRLGEGESLVNNHIMDMVRTRKGEILLATSGGGTDMIADTDLLSSKIKFRHFSTSTGLSSDMNQALFESYDSNVWIISEASLSCFNPATGISSNYLKRFFDGRFSFSEAKPLCLPDSQLLIGTSQGILYVDPTLIAKSQFIPPIVFGCDSIVNLSPDQPNFSVQFAALDYNKNEDIQYAYRMDGIDDQWQYTRTNEINYIGLSPGAYQLRVKSTNGDGVWVDNERVITLFRHASFNETPYAWLFYGVLISAFVALIIWVITYIRKLEEEIKDIKLSNNAKIALLGNRIKELLIKEETVAMIREDDQLLTPEDREFAHKLKAFITRNLSNNELTVSDMASEMCVSRTVLYAKTKSIFDSSPNNLVLNLRIEKAKNLLSSPGAHVYEVAYNCGFSDAKYFSRCFKKLTGFRPSDYGA